MARTICSSKSTEPDLLSSCAVDRHHPGEPVDVTVVVRLDFGVGRAGRVAPATGLDPRGHGIGVSLPRELDQPADDPAHVGLVDRGQLVDWAAKGAAAIDDRQGEGIQRAHVQTGEVGGALISSWARLLNATRQSDRRGEPPLREQVTGPLGEDARLSRTGRGDHPRTTAGMGDRRARIRGRSAAEAFDVNGRNEPVSIATRWTTATLSIASV